MSIPDHDNTLRPAMNASRGFIVGKGLDLLPAEPDEFSGESA